MSHILRFDTTASSANQYTEDIEIELDLVNRSEPDIRREYSTTTTDELEENIQYSIAKRKKGIITEQGSFYFSYQNDKSNGTLQTALFNEDLSTLNDPRLRQDPPVSVDINNDSATFQGDLTRRVDTDGIVVFFGSQITNVIYNVDSVSYDSGADETTVFVEGDIGAVGDGYMQTGIHSVVEQQTWLETYIWDNAGAPQHRIIGERFNDETTDLGTKVVIENVITPKQAGFTTGDYTISLRYGRPI